MNMKKCPAKEVLDRMNYLYQVSNTLAGTSKQNNLLSIHHSNLLVNVSKKTVQRLDIDVKRTICKGCRAIIIPGISCRVRIEKKAVKWICSICGTRKVFKVNKHHVPWTMRPEALVEVIDYGRQLEEKSHPKPANSLSSNSPVNKS